MLRGLDIRDMLIIDRLGLDFRAGLNVLTGETGAGKSILLDALGFVLGWRGRADVVRGGAESGEVSAWFDLPVDHPSHAVLEEAGLPDGDELLLRRTVTPDGRKSAWINDRRASGEVLRRLSDTLVELHGQNDDRGLLNPRSHRDLLDTYGGHEDLLTQTRAAWRALANADRALTDAEAALTAARGEEDFLRHAVSEIDALSPQPGEDEALDTRRRLMRAAVSLRDDVGRAAEALGPDGAEGRMLDATRWLDSAAEGAEGRLDDPLEALGRALDALSEAQSGVDSALEAMTFDPAELEATEERLFALRAVARKHGVAPDDLHELVEELRVRLTALDDGAEGLERFAAARADAARAYENSAGRLTAARADAAGRLDAAMEDELAPLRMNRAVFRTELSAADSGPAGRDTVTFTVATNPGATPGPLNRIASGGELSRFLLALKVCLSSDTPGLTLIFDEIDRGVGGATANAVGRRLAALARHAQVLVVTHSPQVAALADHHWRVEKLTGRTSTTSTVVPLDPGARIDEIARMLAGDSITEEARGAARALLAG
jgi:DNA repair protein RecN (Recombination protein N)